MRHESVDHGLFVASLDRSNIVGDQGSAHSQLLTFLPSIKILRVEAVAGSLSRGLRTERYK